MVSILIKLTTTVLIAGVCFFVAYFAGRIAVKSISGIWRVHEVEWKATLLFIKKEVLDQIPFSRVQEWVQEKVELKATLSPLSGYTLIPQAGVTITNEFLQDRKQYAFRLRNDSWSRIRELKLRFQLPYPIENHQIAKAVGISGQTFAPTGGYITVQGGSTHFFRTPLYRSYELVLQEMNPNGEIEVLFLLNSWRDPRGKNIPREEAARYRVPESSPTLTYVHGTFKVSVGDEAIDNVYYAPIELKEDKTIVLGSTSSPPKTLILEEGFE